MWVLSSGTDLQEIRGRISFSKLERNVLTEREISAFIY